MTEPEQIWQLYPNKLGKKQAIPHIERAIREIGFDELKRRVETWVAETVRRQAACSFWPNMPHGSTYFRNDRWEDEFPPMPQDVAPNSDGAVSRETRLAEMIADARKSLGDVAARMTDQEVYEAIPLIQAGKAGEVRQRYNQGH